MVSQGDRIELLSSTKKNSLLEGEEYLHGLLIVSPAQPELVSTMGWFASECIRDESGEPMVIGDDEPLIQGDVEDG